MTLALLLVVGCSGAPETAEAPPQPEAPAQAEEPTPEPAAASSDWASFGEAVPEGEVVSAAALLDAPDTFLDKTLVVEGRVADVCQKAGCWMVIEDQGRTMRVTMKDHAFSVAKDGAGSSCQVHGLVTRKTIDPDTVAHLESESVNVAAMPEKQTTDDFVYEIVASGVRLKPAEG